MSSVYATPQYVSSLATSTPMSQHIKVDWEIWGCPPNSKQVLEAIRFLLFHATPRIKRDAVCMECKRQNNVCVLVANKQPCMGPVTQTGCGSLCPNINRECYACFGPSENSNPESLGNWFIKNGSNKEVVARQFLHLNNSASAFKKAGQQFKRIPIKKEPQ